MADEIAELVVKIRGDTSDLETAISSVTKELMAVEKSGASAGKGLAVYEKQLRQAETAMQNSRNALANAKKAYDSNLSSMEKNSAELRKQKSNLENLITAKNNEIKALEKANTVVNKGSDAYKNNQKALQWTKTELSALQTEHKSVTTALKTQESELARSKQAYNEASAAVEKATKKYAEYEKGLKSVQKAEKAKNLQKTGKNMKELGSSLDTITKPMQNMALATAAGGVAAAKFAIDFEDNFANVKKTVDGTDEQLENVKQAIIDMSTVGIDGHHAIPLTTEELTELAAAGGQLGIETDNIAHFTETMAMLGTATNLAGESGAQTLARFMNVANVSQQDIDRLGSSIVDLGNHFATTEAEIADMAMDMGATGATVGMSAQDILGYATALSSMGIEAAAGGSALQRIWMDMQNAVSKGGKSLDAFAKTSGKSSKDFQKAWKNDATDAFNDFLKGLNQSGDKVGLLSQLGFENVRDQRALLALAGEKGFDVLTRAIDRSNKAWEENTALITEFEDKAETTSSQLAIAKNNIVNAGRSLGETFLPTIAVASGKVADFAKWLANLGEGGKKAVIGIGATVIGLGALAKTGAGTIKTIGGVLEAVGKIKSFIAGTGGSAVGTAAASGTGEAAVSAGTAAAGVGSFSAGLGSATAASAAALAPLAVLEAAFGAVYVGAAAASKGIEAHKKKLGELGSEAEEAANKAKQAWQHSDDIHKQTDELDNYIAEWNALKDRLADGTAEPQEIERLKGLEQWFIDNYGDYISAEEKKNGIRAESIDFLRRYADELRTVADEEKKQTQQKAVNKVEEGKKKAPEIAENISKTESIIKQQEAEAENARSLINELQRVKEQYDRIDKTLTGDRREKAIAKLKEDSKATSDAYKAMFGQDIDVYNIDKNLGNVNGFLAETNSNIEKNKSDIEKWKQSLDGYSKAAQAVVEMQSGMTFAEAAEKNTAKIKILKGALDELKSTGSLSDGFMEALKKDLPDVANGFDSAADKAQYLQDALNKQETSGLSDMENSLADILHKMNILPETATVHINDDGTISYVGGALDNAEEKIYELDGKTATVILNADKEPAFAAINGVTYKLDDYDKKTGTAHITAEDGASYIIDTVSGKIRALNVSSATPVITADDQTADGVKSAQDSLEEVKDKEVTLKVVLKRILGEDTWNTLGGAFNKFIGYKPEKYAAGKSAFDNYEGPAIVNDGAGPEAIEDKSGNIRIPAGRNVLTHVSRDDKVYTAEQTRKMFDVPHFAGGKDNSSGFTAAKESWSSYTKTHAVTTAQELEKWVELSKKFRDNEKDAADIQEEIFSLMQKQNKELNDRSKKYLEEHTALNDWQGVGDDPMAAFERIRQRNIAEAEAGRQTWEEANDAMSSIGSKMYDDRISMSQKWLDHEEKYNNLSADDYLAGIDRMKAYTQQYYDAGMISYREYTEGMSELSDKFFDKQKEQQEELKKQRQELLSSQLELSKSYMSEHNYFNDWNDVEDDPLSAYNRVREREWQAVLDGDKTEEDFNKTMSSVGSEMYGDRQATSMRWLSEQRKYFGMTDEEYVQGLERIKAYTQEYYDNGLISRREYNEAITELRHQMWDEAESAYEDMLEKQQKYISDTREILSKQEQELQDSWTAMDRAEDMSDVQRQLEIYQGAVTDRGQKRYAELQEQMKKLQREEELYQLQVANNATIERLEADYEELENGKAEYMRQIVDNTNIDISGVVGTLTANIQNTGNDVTNLLGQLLDKFDDFQINAPSYTDNKQVIFNEADKATVMAILRGNVGLDK